MSRGPSRKEERKNARLAKKQRKSMHHQKMVDIRKGDLIRANPELQVSVAKPISKPLSKNQSGKKSSTSKPPVSWHKSLLNSDVEEEDDEEILSESDGILDAEDTHFDEKQSSKIKKEKSTKPPKKKKETFKNEDDEDDEEDFLSMMDKAFSSGKLTKEGFIGKDGKVESSKIGSSEDENYFNNDYMMESDISDESSENSETEKIVKDFAPEIELMNSSTTNSKLRKDPSAVLSISRTENVKLLRQVQSLVNKLGSSNLVPICNEFEVIFRENRRKEVIELLTETIISSIVKPGGNLLDSFALNFAALSFIINHMVGIEFGAHLIEKLIETIDSLYIQSKESSIDVNKFPDDPNIYERSLVNCMNFCSFIYDLQMISSNLICDLIRQSAQRLDEIDVEIILKLFKTCGQQIKKDDADFMKVISSEITKKSVEIPKESQSSRFKFMIETINDLKDSKRKLASAMTVELEPVKKMLKNFLTQKLISKIEPLRISLEDIRNIETKGKWWLVGSSWHPQGATAIFESDNIKNNSQIYKRNEEVIKIEKLAKAQRMNTEIRKTIFSTIVSSEDFSDAFERILALKLTGKQEREIILVIIHCCGQEKVFNPFYALLAGKFASYRQGFKITLQYTLWDCFRQLKDYPLRKLANIAKLYGMLLAQEDLPLSILRKGNFIRLKDEERIFWQLLFMTLFTRIPSDDELTNITQTFVNSIATGITDNPSSSSSSGNVKSKVISLTENVDMAEFDDDFFAAQDKIKNSRGMSPEKLEECKNLRNGMSYLLDVYFIKSNDFPFTSGIEISKKRAKIMKRILSN